MLSRYMINNRRVGDGLDVINRLINYIESDIDGVVTTFKPDVNTREDDSAYYIEMDLPGVSKEDIEIKSEDNILTISGERKQKESTKDNEYYRIESIYGKFSRSFTLPEKIIKEKIDAKFENGVLEIVIPKNIEETKPRIIKID